MIIGIIAVIVILAIVIPIAIAKDKENPVPTPDNTITVYNPYYGEMTDNLGWTISGLIKIKESAS